MYMLLPSCSVISDCLQLRGLWPASSSVHGDSLQARILEWVAIPSSRGSSWPRIRNGVSCPVSISYSLNFPRLYHTAETPCYSHTWQVLCRLTSLFLCHLSIFHIPHLLLPFETFMLVWTCCSISLFHDSHPGGFPSRLYGGILFISSSCWYLVSWTPFLIQSWFTSLF